MTRRKATPPPATVPIDDVQHAFVHDRTLERRDQRRRHEAMGFYTVQTFRYVCACGFATSWNDDVRKSRRLIDRHGVDGQLGLIVPT